MVGEFATRVARAARLLGIGERSKKDQDACHV